MTSDGNKLSGGEGRDVGIKRIQTPLADDVIQSLRTGEKVLLSGFIYTARDAAHKRFAEALDAGKELPFDIRGQVIYYCGPAPAPPGKVIGSCGPTTSSRMDVYAPRLIGLGLKGMIGKGKRSEAVKKALQEHRAVYFGATGGAGALIARTVVTSRVIAYEDLGPEAVVRLEVRDMPLFVINDTFAGDLYQEGMERYKG